MEFSTGCTIPKWNIYGSVCDQGTGWWVLQEIKRFQRMVDYCPCRYWLLSRSSLETPPACPLDADQAICAGHPQWIFLWFFTCMIMKTLAWQSLFSELCVKKESIRLERWSLTTVQRTLTSYIKIERKNTHTHKAAHDGAKLQARQSSWESPTLQQHSLPTSHRCTTQEQVKKIKCNCEGCDNGLGP